MKKENNGICGLLSTLPTNSLVTRIVADGYPQTVTRFVNFEEDTHLAYFSNGAQIVIADCRKISLIITS